MDERTREYLAGRFGDHYRRATIANPPDAHTREWGYIPWETGGGTTMVRHRSLTELGSLADFLTQEQARHVYFSAGHYGDPGASRMGAKDWRGSDLIFDLDADHLPTVNPETDSFRAMLEACKEELFALLSFLEEDFGFGDPTVVFSGNRGYHVHIRSDDVTQLDRQARRDIVEYVRGEGVSVETVLHTSHVTGAGRTTPAQTRRLDIDGGWSRRVHREVVAFVDELVAMDHEEALESLRSIEGIGAQRADALVTAIDDRRSELESGNVDIHPAMMRLLAELIDRAISRQSAAIDEPVTTDINRLIRLPGSLHGGSGLQVTELHREELGSFDPLVDPIPPTFRGHQIAIEVTSPSTVELGENTRELSSGPVRLPEYAAIHLMARGVARKVPESTI